MAKSLIRRIRGLHGAFIKVIMSSKDKSTRLGKMFLSQVHIKEIIEQLKTDDQYPQLVTCKKRT